MSKKYRALLSPSSSSSWYRQAQHTTMSAFGDMLKSAFANHWMLMVGALVVLYLVYQYVYVPNRDVLKMGRQAREFIVDSGRRAGCVVATDESTLYCPASEALGNKPESLPIIFSNILANTPLALWLSPPQYNDGGGGEQPNGPSAQSLNPHSFENDAEGLLYRGDSGPVLPPVPVRYPPAGGGGEKRNEQLPFEPIVVGKKSKSAQQSAAVIAPAASPAGGDLNKPSGEYVLFPNVPQQEIDSQEARYR